MLKALPNISAIIVYFTLLYARYKDEVQKKQMGCGIV